MTSKFLRHFKCLKKKRSESNFFWNFILLSICFLSTNLDKHLKPLDTSFEPLTNQAL